MFTPIAFYGKGGKPLIVIRLQDVGGVTPVAYSTDGVNFTQVNLTSPSNAVGTIQYLDSQDMFLAPELGAGSWYHTSIDDGKTWTRIAQPGSGTRGVRGGMIYDNKVYLMQNGGKLIESSDGINWNTYTWNGTGIGLGVATNGSIFVITTGGTGTQRLQSSTNLNTWTNRIDIGSGVSNVDWVEDFGLFIAYSVAGNFYTSSDGTSWDTRTVPSKGTSNSNRFPINAYSPKLGLYVMVNSDNAIRWSDDGITYTLGTLPGGYTDRPQSVIWVDKLGKFFAYGNTSANAASNIVLVSTDGKVWTQETANVNIDAVQCAVKQ
jgi:hypothetical protein